MEKNWLDNYLGWINRRMMMMIPNPLKYFSTVSHLFHTHRDVYSTSLNDVFKIKNIFQLIDENIFLVYDGLSIGNFSLQCAVNQSAFENNMNNS